MCGYFSGLSVPSVTEASTTRAASPRSNRAGQTRLPTFSMTTTEPRRRVQGAQRAADHGRVEVAARAGVDLDHLAARGADAVGVQRGLLVALHDRR